MISEKYFPAVMKIYRNYCIALASRSSCRLSVVSLTVKNVLWLNVRRKELAIPLYKAISTTC